MSLGSCLYAFSLLCQFRFQASFPFRWDKIIDMSELLCYELSRPTRKEGAFDSVGCPRSQALSGHSRGMYTHVCINRMSVSGNHADFFNSNPPAQGCCKPFSLSPCVLTPFPDSEKPASISLICLLSWLMLQFAIHSALPAADSPSLWTPSSSCLGSDTRLCRLPPCLIGALPRLPPAPRNKPHTPENTLRVDAFLTRWA